MELVRAIAYGIVQGLTEYLPISSTAHIRIIPTLFGWPDPGSAYTAVIQIGTIIAVLLYFGKDIGHAISAWFQSIYKKEVRNTPEAKLGWAVFIGTLPIIVIGLAAKDQIETPLRSYTVIGYSLIVMAIVLFVAERFAKKTRGVESSNWKDGLIVGLWQCISLIPGASRSGSTISGAFFQGFDKEAAARFAFLLSVPSVLASGIFELIKERHNLLANGPMPILLANIVSFAVGYWSISFLMKILRTKSLTPFVIYRIVLGMILISLVSMGKLDPYAGLPSEDIKPHVLQETNS